MKDLIEYFDTIEQSFRKSKLMLIIAFSCCAVIVLGTVLISFTSVRSMSGKVYVLDSEGAAYTAGSVDEAAVRHRECIDHVCTFHRLMFGVVPYKSTIERNVEAALALCDRSGYNYYRDLAEKGFYSRIVEANIVQDFVVDSVKVDMNVYPHAVSTYARIYVLRESNITEYEFESTGRLVDVGRTDSNPHGLMLERFAVVRNEKIHTKRR